MFCRQCANEINLNDKYCNKCGTAILASHNDPTQKPVTKPQTPNFGSPKAKWWGKLPEKKSFPKPYEWLNEKNTLIIFDNHLALVRGTEESSQAAKMMTAVGAGGLALLPVGIAVGAARNLKDKITNKLDNYDSIRTLDLFNAGEFVWCKKTDAEIWEIQRKRFLGIKTPSETALYGLFISLVGTLEFVFPLEDTQVSLITDPIKNIGCKIIIKEKGLTDYEAAVAYNNLFKTFTKHDQ